MSWLRRRLSPVKIDEPRWQDFAAAIELFWEQLFDGEFQKLVNLRSIYTADDEGQRLIVAELGSYYSDGLPVENRAIQVGMRKLELLQKDTDIPLKAGIQRLGVRGVQWQPLYALEADGPYGTKFYHEDIGIPEGAYLTSRGLLAIELGEIPDESAIPAIESWVRTTKPEHIVYDGVAYSLTLKAPAPVVVATSLEATETLEVFPALGLCTEDGIALCTEDSIPLQK